MKYDMIIQPKSKVGLMNGRVNPKDFANIFCLYLAMYGFHGKLIAKYTELTVSQVYYRLQLHNIQLRNYRDGKTLPAKKVLKKFNTSRISPTLRKKVANQIIG